MTAKEIIAKKESIYDKLVRLNYSRKENYLIEVSSTNWFDLDFELKEIPLIKACTKWKGSVEDGLLFCNLLRLFMCILTLSVALVS